MKNSPKLSAGKAQILGDPAPPNPQSAIRNPQSEVPDLPDYAADLEAEEAFGTRRCCAVDGVRLMEDRILGLTAEAAGLLESDAPEALECARYVMGQLREARIRLAGYKQMAESKN